MLGFSRDRILSDFRDLKPSKKLFKVADCVGLLVLQVAGFSHLMNVCVNHDPFLLSYPVDYDQSSKFGSKKDIRSVGPVSKASPATPTITRITMISNFYILLLCRII
jgi:hypothetical protein